MAVVDLGVVAELRKEKDAALEEVKAVRDQLQNIQIQMGAIIHKAPDHKIHMSEQDYMNLPAPFQFMQEDHDDGTFTLSVHPVKLSG